MSESDTVEGGITEKAGLSSAFLDSHEKRGVIQALRDNTVVEFESMASVLTDMLLGNR